MKTNEYLMIDDFVIGIIDWNMKQFFVSLDWRREIHAMIEKPNHHLSFLVDIFSQTYEVFIDFDKRKVRVKKIGESYVF